MHVYLLRSIHNKLFSKIEVHTGNSYKYIFCLREWVKSNTLLLEDTRNDVLDKVFGEIIIVNKGVHSDQSCNGTYLWYSWEKCK